MARKFLYFVAICIVLVLVALAAMRLWSKEFAELAFVPSSEFEAQQPLATNSYDDPAMWYSRPGMKGDDPARWQPAMQAEAESDMPPTATPGISGISSASQTGTRQNYSVFFIHPTSYMSRSHWNAPLDDEEARETAILFIKGMATPFNGASAIWAPRYRQATLGAFLTDDPAGKQAQDAAYADILQAFDTFLAETAPDQPIVLAGHSQGALHLMHLLRDRVSGTALQDRVIAAYVIGWPISVEHDLPAMGLPACAETGQTGCILSWSSYGEPADPSLVTDTYRESIGLDGTKRGNSIILCTNPLTGGIGDSAPKQANMGTLVPDENLENGKLVPHYVPALCDSRGLLLIGEAPKMGDAVLPGNNYHVYDIPLFWANVKSDVTERAAAWQAGQ